MLHYKTIETSTLELLKALLAIPDFANLRLAGGTSLALQIGHRTSIDLDLFGTISKEPDEILEIIRPLGNIITLKNTRNIHTFIINNIKVDIIHYTYPWLAPANNTDSLRLASMKDICAMKLAAIAGRGTKKDFIDIYFLLQHFTLDEMFHFYSEKYADGSLFMIIKSLSYFDDAEEDPEPLMFNHIEWHVIKQEIQKQISSFSSL
ncbi:MAG: nucleotidyl transferase AbiEii/AbiGii toxin family protein [Parabacteroides sp.]|nr:nucleotidyl transferase AbiEii/AbiGii toxin family protein [Parabacteroides sp.]